MKKGITCRNTGMPGTCKGHPYLILFNVKMLPDFTTPESKRGTNRKDMRQKGKYGQKEVGMEVKWKRERTKELVTSEDNRLADPGKALVLTG